MPRKRKRQQPVADIGTGLKREEPEKDKTASHVSTEQAEASGAVTKKKNKQKSKKRKIEENESVSLKHDNSVKNIAGYSIVPIRLPSYPDGQRYIYYKENVNKGDEAEAKSTPNGKTLILVNLPVSITEEHLQQIFGRFGRIQSITFKRLVATDLGALPDSTGQRGVFAHLVFTSPKSVPKALEFQWDRAELPSSSPEGLGLEKWLEGYKGTRPDSSSIMAEVDAFMFDFDKKQELARLEAERSFGKPDKDGFILVQRGRGKLRDGKVNVTATKVTPDLIEKSKKTAVLEDFYRFQRRENMRKQLADLRIRFEEDKKRIAKMRAQRRFRPG